MVVTEDAARKLLEEALALPKEQQRWLADQLLEVVPADEEVAEAWAGEAVTRLERAERGEAKLVSYDEVRERAQRVLRDK